MEYSWINLPLYDDWDYKYTVPVGSQNIEWRIYYSDRTETWMLDASLSTGEPIVQGIALLKLTPMFENKIEGVNGFLWLEPIAQESNEALLHPDLLYKYYNLYYIFWE